MREYLKFYIDGQWVDPVEPQTLDVINPATEQVCGKIALGSAADVDRAVTAARKAFATWSLTSREERLDVLTAHPRANTRSVSATSPRRSPKRWARRPRSPTAFRWGSGLGTSNTAIEVLKNFRFEEHARRDDDREGADRRLRPDHALELADEPDRRQGVPGARDRLHHGAQALRSCAVLGADLRRDHGRRAACPPACSISSRATARASARRSPAIPMST